MRSTLSLGLIGLLLSILAVASPAQESAKSTSQIDLQTAIDQAVKYNHDVQSQKLAYVKFQREKEIFEDNINYPQVEVLTFIAPIYDSKGNALNASNDFGKWGPLFQYNLQLVWPLYNFGAKSSGKKAYEFGLKAAAADKQIAINDTVYQVKKAYYQVLLVNKLNKFAEEVETNITEILSKAREMYQKDDGGVQEKDIIQLELFEIEFLKVKNTLRTNTKLAGKQLAFLMGADPQKKVEIVDSNFPKGTINLPPLKNFLTLALKHKPEYKKARAGLQGFRHRQEALEARNYPEIFVAGTFKHRMSTVGESDVTNPYFYNPYNSLEGGVAIGARWRLDFYKTNESDKAAVETKEVELQSKKAFTGIPVLIEHSYLKAQETAGNVDLAIRAYRKAGVWVGTSQNGFELGTVKAEDFLKAYAAYLDAKRKFYEAKFAYQLALAELAKQVGKSSGLQQGKK